MDAPADLAMAKPFDLLALYHLAIHPYDGFPAGRVPYVWIYDTLSGRFFHA